jgi:hypothetical protein
MSEFRSKMKCLRQGVYKQGCHKVSSCPQTPGVCLGLFDDTCINASDRKEGYVLKRLQRGLRATTETWCERRNIKVN